MISFKATEKKKTATMQIICFLIFTVQRWAEVIEGQKI